ncbi:AaceriAEL345Wp [[Ashbya] aceris (nom. inval.)]|nr:AaceriAEL345Wp [[Ashbya] aceris (nom. inval.)]
MHLRWHMFRGKLRPVLGAIALAIAASTCFFGLSLLTEELKQWVLIPIGQLLHLFWPVDPQYSEISPLKFMLEEDPSLVASWDLRERCKRYFDLTYRKNPAWSNQITFLQRDIVPDALYTARLMERWRIFTDCFIEGNEPLSTTLDEAIDIFDFQQRMYPFLAKARCWEEIWPNITDLNTGEHYRPGILNDGRRLNIDDNISFWKNWQIFSKGKGIIITAGAEHVEMLPRLLTVLDHLGNSLPVELINMGDLPTETIKKVAEYVQTKSNQSVRLVDCGKTMEENYRSSITSFRHKWLAYIFNTFEEAVFIDLDAVPFVNIEKFFEIEGYKSTGIAMFRDRSYDGQKPDECIKAMRMMMPSSEEQTLWQHQAKYTKKVNEDVMRNNPIDAGAATFYNKYMEGKSYHMAESGLIVMHKKKKLSSLINSFMLHMNFANHWCSHGDKEYLWLGQLISGETYYVDPLPAAALGVPQLLNNGGHLDEYKICSAQIAHMDKDGSILWVNGGLKNCKFDAVEKDFGEYPDYFSTTYTSRENLQKFYDLGLDIQMAFIPDFVGGTWTKARECRAFTWCSTIKADSMASAGLQSYIIQKGDSRLGAYNKIAEIWSKSPFLSSIA